MTAPIVCEAVTRVTLADLGAGMLFGLGIAIGLGLAALTYRWWRI